MAETVRECDVLVVGAGMAGLVAGLRAAESGRDVLVVEKGDRAGGSMYVSGGIIWTLPSTEDARERVPEGNPELQDLVVESLEEGLAWLEGHGVTLKEPSTDLPGPGRQIEPPEFTERMTERLAAHGGSLALETGLAELQTGDTGGVTGARARGPDGDAVAVTAESVVLATGGFQGSERLVQTYITDHTENLWLRANPWSTGDGFVAASDVGAKATRGLGTFYGHSLPAPPAEFKPVQFTEVTQYYGPWAVALGRDGTRFTDESDSHLEETLTQDVARRAGGRAYFVLDEALHGDTTGTGKSIARMVESAREVGGRVARAESLEALGVALDDWGVDGDRARRTIDTYNEAVREGRGDRLSPPRRDFQRPLDEPPYYAVEVQPGITFTMGGLDVTGECAVLARAGTTSSIEHYPETPSAVTRGTIDGLYAAGVDVGNVCHRYYIGGLSLALTTGIVAGESAAANARGG